MSNLYYRYILFGVQMRRGLAHRLDCKCTHEDFCHRACSYLTLDIGRQYGKILRTWPLKQNKINGNYIKQLPY